LDESGRLHVVGRIKEMLKVKGINIAPVEVENLLCDHPSVDQAYVVGLADPHGDEYMVAAVVARTRAAITPSDLAADLIVHMRACAASYKVPAHIEVLSQDQLPLTDTGKVSKLVLRELLASHWGLSAALRQTGAR